MLWTTRRHLDWTGLVWGRESSRRRSRLRRFGMRLMKGSGLGSAPKSAKTPGRDGISARAGFAGSTGRTEEHAGFRVSVRSEFEVGRDIFSFIGFLQMIDFAEFSGNRFGVMFLISAILWSGDRKREGCSELLGHIHDSASVASKLLSCKVDFGARKRVRPLRLRSGQALRAGRYHSCSVLSFRLSAPRHAESPSLRDGLSALSFIIASGEKSPTSVSHCGLCGYSAEGLTGSRRRRL